MTTQEVFKKYNTKKDFTHLKFVKSTFHGGHNRWIVKYPKVNTVIRQLKDGLKDGVIDYNWITDHFGGNVSSFVSGMSQQEANKLGKVQTLSWEDFVSTRETDSDLFFKETAGMKTEERLEMINKLMFENEWNMYRKPQQINYMKCKDLKARTLDMWDNKVDGVVDINGTPLKDKNGVFTTYGKFLLEDASFRTISKTQFNIFTPATENFNGGIFARNGKLKSNDPEEVGEFVCQMTYNENEFKKDTDAIAKLWEWRTKRNEKRSILEETFGYDTKHLSHCLRLLKGGANILTSGEYQPRLTGATLELVRDVLAGKFPYDEVVGMAEELEKGLQSLYETSTLPKSPNHKRANKLLLELSRKF